MEPGGVYVLCSMNSMGSGSQSLNVFRDRNREKRKKILCIYKECNGAV